MERVAFEEVQGRDLRVEGQVLGLGEQVDIALHRGFQPGQVDAGQGFVVDLSSGISTAQ
ncbi:hypothetical protein [Arthrobacter sp. JCM 19049]|uniref:hypothetical protein n=1 Tax=Arthrobacter sp. JCM 19049 TaxID=1460643 RepID=UPI0024364AC4|nr:hypothetical protein [Arthrobacter sp. JCM 19049]